MGFEPIEFDVFGHYDVVKSWDLSVQIENYAVSSFCMALEDVVSDAGVTSRQVV